MVRIDHATVAIIMRSKNEQPYAERSLQSLKKQSYQDFVLYNIDSGSTDGTLEAIYRYNPVFRNITQISPNEYNPGRVLNMMIEKTVEPIIVFLNSDAVPLDSFWLENLLKPVLKGEADASMSKQVPRKDAHFIVAYDYLRAYDSKNLKKKPYAFSAVSCAFKRILWEETKFYTEGYSEDVLWSKACQSKGAKFQFVSNSIVEHSHNYTLKEWYRRKYGEGIADMYIYGVHPNWFKRLKFLMKDCMRDLIFAIYQRKFETIPYNIVYRTTAHLGAYFGEKEGLRRIASK